MESRLAAALAAALLLGGCATRVRPIEPLLPLRPPPPPGLDDVSVDLSQYGVLVIDRGCIRMREFHGRARRTILWPTDTHLGHDERGYFLHREGGGRQFRVGTPYEFGGGSMWNSAPPGTDAAVIQRCGPPYARGSLFG